ncbi:hypothetical protein [Paenibacillus tianjinensis]|uniref:Uncharacterized protein n=1 Tax=Paenibacillus tianjinensis TaxID=2810347 RepID=A0ABX7LGY6_9BACL|nr:hypothetical protein [Paenibacillus tianjinensis]QSF47360.1 hypothetical protein JRJ22_12760 [Paenibacillus tianjinensis]
MEEVRIQKNDRAVSFRVIEDVGEYIVFDMSLTGPARNRMSYSGGVFQEAWQAVEAILGEISIPEELRKYANRF